MVCPVLLQAERSECLFRPPPVVLPLGILPRVPLSHQFPCVSATTATYCRDGGGAVDSLVIRQNAAKFRAWQWIKEACPKHFEGPVYTPQRAPPH